MTHRNSVRLSKLSLALVAALAAAPLFAQSTSSGVIGHVVSADGQPVAGAEVTITHVESGTVSRTVTDASGNYASRGLRVGGPYTITVNKAGAGVSTQQNVYLQLNQVADIDATLSPDVATLGGVQVVASAISDVFSSENKGVGTSISGRQLETAVSGNRSLDDIARLDPRITVTDSADGTISVAGQNNRYNNISVDGLGVNDPFGLASNGLGFTGSPISPDTIAAYDIKISDFDVSTDSIGANINAVTKSGTNEFHGSLYYALTDGNSMVGDLGGPDFNLFDKNKTWGVTLGGPILKDRLFFFLGYEDQKTNGLGAGSGVDAVTSGMLTQAQVDAVADAFETSGIVTGGSGGGGTVALQDKRTLGKIDWNISDSQRASFTYQKTEEAKPGPYSSYLKSSSVILPSNWYTAASRTDNYSVQLFSDWSDNFSTELKVGYQKYDNTNAASSEQPEVVACFTSATCGFGSTPTSGPPARSISASIPWVVAGEDWYRHENAISSKKWTATLSGTYYAGDHTIKGGVDFQSNESFDIFGQGLHGSYLFSDKNGNGTPVDEIAAGNYYVFVKTYLPAGVDLASSGGLWKYSQISPFLQDTWQVNDNLSISYGVRVNIPKADHAPPVAVAGADLPATPLSPAVAEGEPVWEGRFGFPSDTTLGSKNKVIMPRFAFNYSFDTVRKSQLRGGLGLFQSTPPTVWLSNPYINNAVYSSRTYVSTDSTANPYSTDPYNQPGPTGAVSGICGGAGGTCGNIDVLDPDFKLPTSWKFSLGYDVELPWGLTGSIEYLHLQAKDAIAYKQLNVGVPNDAVVLPDGRDNYWAAASATGIGSGNTYGRNPEFGNGSTLLTNTDKGHTDSITFALAKALSHGFTGNFSITQSHSTDVTPGTSSQAASNYNYVARYNANDFEEATARFDIPLSVKASLSWDHAFFGDNRTTVSVFYNGHDGQPYSWIYGNDVNGDSYGFNDLAYVPELNDPNVVYKAGTTAAQIEAFQKLIDSDAYLSSHRGQVVERNGDRQPWINQLDLGVQQELPGFFNGNKIVVRLDVYNFLNMLNKDWGSQEGLGYFATRRLANVSDVNASGQYVYDLGTPTSPSWQSYGVYDSIGTPPSRVTSRWSAVLTLKYQF